MPEPKKPRHAVGTHFECGCIQEGALCAEGQKLWDDAKGQRETSPLRQMYREHLANRKRAYAG
jgi:hypothetical protein